MAAAGRARDPGAGLTVRELEKVLRAAGCSRREAKRLAGAVFRECVKRADVQTAAKRLTDALKAS